MLLLNHSYYICVQYLLLCYITQHVTSLIFTCLPQHTSPISKPLRSLCVILEGPEACHIQPISHGARYVCHVLPQSKVLILIRLIEALIDCFEVFEPGGCLLFSVVKSGQVLSRESPHPKEMSPETCCFHSGRMLFSVQMRFQSAYSIINITYCIILTSFTECGH